GERADGLAPATADVENGRVWSDGEVAERPPRQAAVRAVHRPRDEPTYRSARPAELTEHVRAHAERRDPRKRRAEDRRRVRAHSVGMARATPTISMSCVDSRFQSARPNRDTKSSCAAR